MAEELKENKSEDYQFINEKILSKKKKKWLKRLGTIAFVSFLAILFGVISKATFLLSEDYLKDWLGIEEKRQEVNLPKPTTQVGVPLSPTPKPVKTPTPVPTIQPTQMPDENEIQSEDENTQTYLQIYDSIRDVAKEVSDSFVRVEAIEQGVDWFQDVYEKRTCTTGLILGNDGVDLLILVGTEQFSGATSIEVYIGTEKVEGSIYSMDKDYGLAVIAVPLKAVSQEILEQIQPGILADAEAIAVGTPVIALGAPNGYEGAMEFGMITSLGSTVSVSDGEVAYFTTNIAENLSGYGFVVNLEGEILGLITHTHKKNPTDGIFSAVSLDSIRGVIIKLLNNAERAYFGIKGQDLPENLASEYELQAGVYVSEVENSSPALGAGIKAGDILLSVGEKPIEGIRTFSDVILECGIREIVQVKLLRQTEDGLREITAEVTLIEK
ncbi:MAG: serine protease [Lachnospiraceae bacterium]|nr:serine protease [Lachnospiraceae bacterium]